MVKQLILPLVGVALFVIAVGVFIQKSGSLNLSKLAPASATPSSGLKSMTVNGKSISVEIANTPSLRAKGLSGRALLGLDNGMLFVFDEPNVNPGFFMKGMLIPLDIIWINDSVVVKIDKNVPAPAPDTPDGALEVFYPPMPVDYVLEVNAGYSDKNAIKVGSQVILPTGL